MISIKNLIAIITTALIVLVFGDSETFHEDGHVTRVTNIGHLELKITTYTMADAETVAKKVELHMDGESMSSWDTGTCLGDENAEEIVRLTEAMDKSKSKVLVVGLGGGIIASKLSKDHDVTVLEFDSMVLYTAPKVWEHMEGCGFDGSQVKVVRGSFHSPPIFDHKFDVVIVDTPSVYKDHDYSLLHEIHDYVDDHDSVLITHSWGPMPDIVDSLPHWDHRVHTTVNSALNHIYVSDWRWHTTDEVDLDIHGEL